MKQVIYLAQAGDAVKIGVTTDLKRRLISLQTGCPLEIKYIYTGNVSSKRGMTEEQLHRKFEDYKLRGEWYKAQPILEYLANGNVNLERKMDLAWSIKMEQEVERLIIEHRNRFK